jgi:hypothetical protein
MPCTHEYGFALLQTMAPTPTARCGCAHSAPIGIRAAIWPMGPGAGNRQVGIVLAPDTRPLEMREREGPRPETRVGLPD